MYFSVDWRATAQSPTAEGTALRLSACVSDRWTEDPRARREGVVTSQRRCAF
jgi:hypothetical protein